MKVLVVVDAQNEFSAEGQRAVPNHATALDHIQRHVDDVRRAGHPIAWVQHFNRPNESPAFVPGTWGAELSPGLGPREGFGPERLFTKDVFGAFTATGLEEWLHAVGGNDLLIVGFFAHMCLSTSVREALIRGFSVAVDPRATGARDLQDEVLGRLTAEEVTRSALLQLVNMGASVWQPTQSSHAAAFAAASQ